MACRTRTSLNGAIVLARPRKFQSLLGAFIKKTPAAPRSELSLLAGRPKARSSDPCCTRSARSSAEGRYLSSTPGLRTWFLVPVTRVRRQQVLAAGLPRCSLHVGPGAHHVGPVVAARP